MNVFEESENLIGHLDHMNATMRVKAGMSQQLTEETVVHEIVHGITLCEGVSENFVGRVSQDLYGVLRENGLLREGWLEKLIDTDDSGDIVDGTDPVRAVDRPAQEGLAR